VLLLDGGDFVHRSSTTEGIANWKEMNRLGYAAVTLGEMEFRTWDLVESLMVAHPLPIVCTNVEKLVGDRWVPIGDPYRILEMNGVRVGVMSVIGKSQLSDPVVSGTEDRIRRLEPMETTRKVAAVLREKADIVVLLAHLDPRAMEQYASSLEEVDVLLGGHMVPKDEGPVLIADALVNRSGTRGAHLGITRLVVSPQDEIVDFGGLNVTLSPDFPEDPAVAEAAQMAKDEGARLRKAANVKRREAAKRKREEQLQKQFELQGSQGQGQGQTPEGSEEKK
jgi:2',3'-cyclic-nucleotide 2'-phosphodiesterase (5'-nucleotidase family)